MFCIPFLLSDRPNTLNKWYTCSNCWRIRQCSYRTLSQLNTSRRLTSVRKIRHKLNLQKYLRIECVHFKAKRVLCKCIVHCRLRQLCRGGLHTARHQKKAWSFSTLHTMRAECCCLFANNKYNAIESFRNAWKLFMDVLCSTRSKRTWWWW